MQTKTLDWLLILIFSSFGVIMGILSVFGFTQKLEPFLWLLFGIFTSFFVSKNVIQKTFLHLLIIGIMWGALNGIIQSLFFDTYLTNNPLFIDNINKSVFINPRYFVLLTGPFIGIITGLVLGSLALLFKKFVSLY